MSDAQIQHIESSFKAAQGVELYQQWWTPEKEIKGTVIICHGIAEYSGRYDHVARFLCGLGYRVGSFDLRNHGHSGKGDIFVDKFDDYLADLDVFIANVRASNHAAPLFLLGHSMGGAIVTLYSITRQPDFIKGIVVSAPSVKIGDDISPLLIRVSGLLSMLTPRVKTVTLDITSLSRDPEVMKRINADPYHYRAAIPARTGAELIGATQRIQANMEAVCLPVLILHGTEDHLADIAGSRMLFERVNSSDKTFKSYEGYYHEIMNEIGKDAVLKDIGDWLDAHV